ncbi:MAG: hypothetical protein HKN46_10125 [Acidimicrobiia bacterium]|nr:hypothetical protein [Acidimicrobiia bacterium]
MAAKKKTRKKKAAKKKTGRPRSVMTKAAEEKILTAVRLGNWPDRAAQLHGIDPSTLRSHRERNPEFGTALEKAQAAAENSFLSRMLLHTQNQWTAVAWMLERRWPDRWAKREPSVNLNMGDGAIVHMGDDLKQALRELGTSKSGLAAHLDDLENDDG